MNIEEGYDLAKKQRPGVKIVMGPESCYEKFIDPLYYSDSGMLKGSCSFYEYDVNKMCGFIPKPLVLSLGYLIEKIYASCGADYQLTKSDWEYINQASYQERNDFFRDKIENIINERKL